MRAKQAKTFRGVSDIALPALALTAAVLMTQLSGEAFAEEGSSWQRHACTPDVFRLCKNFIPNHAQITACLQRHRRFLSHDCRIVFSAMR